MNIPKSAIAKAIEGGWYKGFTGNPVRVVMKNSFFNVKEGRVVMFRRSFHALALDPIFWQTLGKSLGWYMSIFKKEKFSKEHSIYPNPFEVAHDFYDLILQGQSTDDFWKELLANPIDLHEK